MRLFRRFCATLIAVLLVMAAVSAISFADTAYPSNKQTFGGTTSFNKYLVLRQDADVPAAKFTFSVSAGAAIPETDTTLPVLAGLSPAGVKIGDTNKQTVFTAGQATTDGAADDGIANSTDKKYATNTVTVDFSSVKFPEPGIYRYVITEAAVPASDTSGRFTHDDVTERTLDVYIVDDGTGTLQVAENGYVMYSGRVTTAPSATETKPDGKSSQYVNEYHTQNLSVTKKVAGNQGSHDKYFKFTVKIENAGAGTVVYVDTTACKTAPTQSAATNTAYTAEVMQTANNITSLTAGEDGKIEHVFYLAHDDTVTVTGIPKGATYSVTEDKEDYANTPPSNASGSIADADVEVLFTNTRTGNVPTGILMSIAAPVLLVIAGICGLVLFRKKKSKNGS